MLFRSVMEAETGWLLATACLTGDEWAHQSAAAQLASIRLAEKKDYEKVQAAAGSEEGMPHATLMNHDRTAVNLANFNAEPSAPQVQKVYNWGRQPDAPHGVAPWRLMVTTQMEVELIDGEQNPARTVALEWLRRLYADPAAKLRTLSAEEMHTHPRPEHVRLSF